MQSSARVIGSGPNGLAAAVLLAQAGLRVEVHEAADTAGGATRSGELTLPGFIHDFGSAVYPWAVSSPFFSELPLAQHGLQWVWSSASLAHPFDDGTALTVERKIDDTALQLGADADGYRTLYEPLVENWPVLVSELLRPMGLPRHLPLMAQFGWQALQSCTSLAKRIFQTDRARALIAGSCAHSTLPLEAPISSAFGIMLGAAAHAVGWPIAQGGSQTITNALISLLTSKGGRVITQSRVETLSGNWSDLTLCDVTPRQFSRMAGTRLPGSYHRSLERYRYGPGVYKVDWALKEPIPWKAKECARAATVHLGGAMEEIAASERANWRREASERPFVLLAQPTLFDPSRAPAGRHTAWAYCHVPNGWEGSMLQKIEAQVERFAPGFQECILARHSRNTAEMQAWDENLIGGDINGGAIDWKQFFLRPTWRRYATPLKGVYLCSSSTPPGAAVHGMCGYWAARWALDWLAKKR